MATMLLETIELPVVPAGMFVLATTTEVTLDTTQLEAVPVFLVAPSTLANPMDAAGEEQDHANHHQYESVCSFFTEAFSLLKPMVDGGTVALAVDPLGGYDDTGTDVHRSF